MAKDPKTLEDMLDAVQLRYYRGWIRWVMMTPTERVHILALVRGGGTVEQIACYLKEIGAPSWEALLMYTYVSECVAD